MLAQALSSNIKRTGLMRTSGNMSRACMQRWTGTMCLLTYMTTLFDTVNRHLPRTTGTCGCAGKALKLDELHMADLYVPIVEQPARHISYEEAVETVKKAWRPRMLGASRTGKAFAQDG